MVILFQRSSSHSDADVALHACGRQSTRLLCVRFPLDHSSTVESRDAARVLACVSVGLGNVDYHDNVSRNLQHPDNWLNMLRA